MAWLHRPDQRRKPAFPFVAAALLSMAATAVFGQSAGQQQAEQHLGQIETVQKAEGYGFRNGSLVVAPVPFSSPMIGSGLALGAGYLFKTGPGANTSFIGIGGLRSDNGSTGAAGIVNLAFPENRWLIKGFAGKADARYELFTGIGPLPVRQDGRIARISAAFGFTPDLSAGPEFRYLETNIFPGSGALPPALQPDASIEIASYGLGFNWDRRSDSDYPTGGTRLTASATRSHVLGGSGREYSKGYVILDGYRAFGARGVLAFRGTVCGAATGTPFFDLCSIGATDNMRGYNSTQFLGLRSASLQAEYRQRFTKRWGGVVFGGTGWTGDTFARLPDGGSHSAFGAGLRYRVSKKFPVDFSVDFSRNTLGDDLLYIYAGQRF